MQAEAEMGPGREKGMAGTQLGVEEAWEQFWGWVKVPQILHREPWKKK